MIPGEYILKKENIHANINRKTVTLEVTNTGDRPIQIGSHFHFFEANKEMSFNREKSLGFRLDIAAGTAVRFEPGEEKEVRLVEISGEKIIVGFNNLVNSKIDTAINEETKQKLHQFLNSKQL